MLKRALTLCLALVMLVGCISCTANKHDYDPNRRLEVLSCDVQYSDAFKTQSADRFANLGAKAIKVYNSINLSQMQKEELQARFLTDMLPIFKSKKLTEEELDTLFCAYEELLQADERTSLAFLSSLYQTAVTVLGASRAGSLAFDHALLYLGKRAEECRARYEKYGYDFFLDDVKRYESLSDKLTSVLGEDKFVSASSMTMMILSLVSGHSMHPSSLGLSFGDSDFLYILAYQGRFFKRQAISAQEWQIFAELFSELIPEKQTSLLSAELYALRKDTYFVRAFAVMPALVSLYASLTDALFADGLWSLDGTIAENERALCRAFLCDEAALSACLTDFETHAATSSLSEEQALRAVALQSEYEEFLHRTPPIAREELIEGMRTIAEGGSGSLTELFRAYAVGQMPYLVFALSRAN